MASAGAKWQQFSLLALSITFFACAAPSTPSHPEVSLPEAAKSHALMIQEGSFDVALTEAKRRRVPLVLDAWASWCEPCRAMRASLFPDPLLAGVADRYVWVAIDRDSSEGKAIAARFKIVPLPTLLVIDSESETPLLRRVGTLSAPELVTLLDVAGSKARVPASIAEAAFVRAVRAEAAGSEEADARALPDYERVLPDAPKAWPLRAFAAKKVVDARQRAKDFAGCVELARTETLDVVPSSELASVLATAIDCAATAKRQDEVKLFAEELSAIARDDRVPMLPADRAFSFGVIVGASRTLGDEAATARNKAEWLAEVTRLRDHARSEAERASLAGSLRRASSTAEIESE